MFFKVDVFKPIQDGPFWGCSRTEGAKKASPLSENLSRISCNDETWYSLVLPYPMKIRKMYESRDTILEFC